MAEVNEQQIAQEAIDIYAQIQELSDKLESYKERLRECAGGNTHKIVVTGKGVVSISKPTESRTRSVLVLNEDILNANTAIKVKLLERRIIEEKEKKTPASRAKVVISINV